MRVGYEFDSSENNYKVNSYAAAFRHIVETFRDLKVDNVAFVWHSYAQVQADRRRKSGGGRVREIEWEGSEGCGALFLPVFGS